MIFTSQLHVTDSCISPLSYFSLSSHGLRAIWSGLNLALATTFLAETLLFLLSSQVIVLVSSSVFDNVKQIVSPTLMVNQHVYCLHFPFTEKENPIYLILLGFCSDCQSHSRGQPTCLNEETRFAALLGFCSWNLTNDKLSSICYSAV